MVNCLSIPAWVSDDDWSLQAIDRKGSTETSSQRIENVYGLIVFVQHDNITLHRVNIDKKKTHKEFEAGKRNQRSSFHFRLQVWRYWRIKLLVRF